MAIEDDSTATADMGRLMRITLVASSTFLIYFGLAKVCLELASINPSASPIWAPTGFAIAAVLLWGYAALPSVFLAALFANATTAGTIETSFVIAIGNTLEAFAAAYAINTFSAGMGTFETSGRVARFALICAIATSISATIGVLSLYLAGLTQLRQVDDVWITWWLGDLAGALVLAPAIILWGRPGTKLRFRQSYDEVALLFAATVLIGIIAFSPLFQGVLQKGPLAFMAVLPLLWAALRLGPRETATIALLLSGFAVWGSVLEAGPFLAPTRNQAFLLLVAFAIATTLPSLTLSADVLTRTRNEVRLRRAQAELDAKIKERTTTLSTTNKALSAEIAHTGRIESALEEQRRHLVEAQRLAQMGSWSWKAPDGAVVWSEQLYKIYGVKPQQFGGTFDAFIGFIHADDRPRIAAIIQDAVRNGHGFLIEERIVRPDGEVRFLRSSGEPVKDAQGKLLQMQGVCQDITEWHHAQKALVETREQLAHAQKIEALGQLTGGAAHDFNNLLGVVLGSLELLRKRLGDDPKSQRLLQNALAGAKRGAALTQRMLAFGRRQELRPETVALPALIRDMNDLLQRSAGPMISIELRFPPDLVAAHVDSNQFELSLINLAVNARDAMPDGGTMTIDAREETLPAGSPTGLPAGRYVCVSVRDSGVGMDAETLARAAEPFFTTKGTGKGTGLGLSMVQGFAEQSGGRLELKSAKGAGTTATIWLPAVEGAAAVAPVRGEHAPHTPAQGKPLNVLLVDDDALVLESTAAMLEELGHKTQQAASGVEGLEAFRRDQTIDVVITDHAMPGMTGEQMAQRLHTERPELPIIIATGYADLIAPSAMPRLNKPYTLDTLAKALEASLVRNS